MVNLDDYRDAIWFADLNNVQLDINDFWPGGLTPTEYKDDMEEFMESMTPFVTFAATATSAIPGYGVLISAGIGLLWSAVQPGVVHKHQEPLKNMLKGVVESQLATQDLKKARSALGQFNMTLDDSILEYARPISLDDIPHVEALATKFADYVAPDGFLSEAFDQIKDNLTTFSPSNHKLLILSMQSMLTAYTFVLTCWQQIAFLERSNGNISGYNRAQLEVITILQGIPSRFAKLQQAVLEETENLKYIRLNGLEKQNDNRVPNDNIEHRRGKPNPYYIAMWIYDSISERNLFRAELQPTSNSAKMIDVFNFIGRAGGGDIRPDGSKDDEHFDQVMDEAIRQYKERLLPSFIHLPFIFLLAGVQEIVREANMLAASNQPMDLPLEPAFVKNAAMLAAPQEALIGLEKGSKVSYRVALHEDAKSPELFSTPWSKLADGALYGKLRPIYVGDGFAAKNTTRKIYRRISEDDKVGILVATLTGHGVMQWPEKSSKPDV